MTIEASPGGLIPPLLYSCSIKPRPKGVKLMPYFEITDGNGTTHTVDLLSEDPTDIKAEFKKFEAKKKAKKVYISTKEDKLASLKVYEPRSQEKNN